MRSAYRQLAGRGRGHQISDTRGRAGDRPRVDRVERIQFSLEGDHGDAALSAQRVETGGDRQVTVIELVSPPTSGAMGRSLFVRGAKAGDAASYFVRAIINGQEQPASKPFALTADARPNYLSIPLKTPAGYKPNDASVGDLDGDGEYEIVLHQTGRAKDNSQSGETDPPILQAYKLDGTRLWEINLGRNIREGAHYTQFMVYDLDGDGRAEVAVKTADGTRDGTGKVIGDAAANHRLVERAMLIRASAEGDDRDRTAARAPTGDE